MTASDVPRPALRQVMILEANPATRLLLEVMARTDGWAVRSFESLAAAGPLDGFVGVVVLDLNAAEGAEEALARSVRDDPRLPPILLLGTDGRDRVIADGTRVAAVAKPFDASAVLDELDRLYPHDVIIDLSDGSGGPLVIRADLQREPEPQRTSTCGDRVIDGKAERPMEWWPQRATDDPT